MSKSQRKRRLRRRQVAAQPRTTARKATVAFTGSLLTTAALAAVPTSAHAASGAASVAAAAADQQAVVGLVEDARRGPQGSSVGPIVELGGRALFSLDDGRHGSELWVSDGSEAGTRLLIDLNTVESTRGNRPGSARPRDLTLVGDTVFFSADDGVHGRELWKTDGSAAGTTRLTDIPSTSTDYDYNYPSSLTAVGSTLYFALDDGVHGRELWKSDGTAAGTGMIVDLNTGTRRGRPLGSSPGNVTAVGDAVYFTADDGVTGRELWRTDGTAAGTELVADIRPGASPQYDDQPASSYPRNLTAVGQTLYFAADDGVHGSELWKSDASGTALFADINPGTVESGYGDGEGETRPAGSRPSSLTAVGSTLYFSADDGTHGSELWKSDGTPAGTGLVADINPDNDGYSYFSYYGLAVLDGTLYFTANDGTHGSELWRSDGTAAGTRMVEDIATGTRRNRPRSSNPRELTVLGDTLYFTADDVTHGRELWSSTGTAAGTRLFADIADGDGDGYSYGAGNLTAVDGELFFTADDGVYGQELWSTAEAARSVPRVANDSRPVISGEVVAGGVLTTTAGSWTPSTGLTHTYQWYVGGRAVKTATRPRFRPGSSDVGKRISVRVITMRDGYRGQVAYSVKTAEVADEPLVNLDRPAARGDAKVGAMLTATRGRWSVKNLTFRFRWSIAGKPVKGADERRFRLPANAAGKPVTVRVTAVRPAGAKSASSKPRVVERR